MAAAGGGGAAVAAPPRGIRAWLRSAFRFATDRNDFRGSEPGRGSGWGRDRGRDRNSGQSWDWHMGIGIRSPVSVPGRDQEHRGRQERRLSLSPLCPVRTPQSTEDILGLKRVQGREQSWGKGWRVLRELGMDWRILRELGKGLESPEGAGKGLSLEKRRLRGNSWLCTTP
ncbi:hypothetical protein DUI87_29696 [Hirundo rustica rustica]|uniref:Uncharacterized protein n=1 Tax=Hirundo rustica rustica TaxID=333673 RepID=A0A3M0IZ18_HIRRU|nr:hypothetical protein DUI87_29696 [Hirundo rustica rustica]